MTNFLIIIGVMLKYFFAIFTLVALLIFISMFGNEIVQFLKLNPQWCIGSGFGCLFACILMFR